MSEPLDMGIVGLGRMGMVHASHLLELERQDGLCRLVAIVDSDGNRAAKFRAATGFNGKVFESVDAYAASGICKATMLVSPTEHHRLHASILVRAAHRVISEKPLTGTLAGDTEFCAELDAKYPHSLMLAFQRRFDPALAYARDLMRSNTIGRVFKIYSALEDSGPPPDGYQSDGILPDMSVHNVDEILWLSGGRMPDRALAVGSLLYNQRVASCKEDFDDAMLYMWFGDDLLGQVQVSRNHVSGYRVESIVYGESGQIQIGRFVQNPQEIAVEAFGKRGRSELLARKIFPGGKGDAQAPEFFERFAAAYKAEARAFIQCCSSGTPFPTNHSDGLRAQRVISAGMSAVCGREKAAPVS